MMMMSVPRNCQFIEKERIERAREAAWESYCFLS